MESTPQSHPTNIEQDEEQIDLKELIFKYLRFWPYIVVCAFLGLFSAFLINRYATPIYKIDASVLVNDEPAGTLGQDIFESAGLGIPKSNVENEMGILKSYTLAFEALSSLNFNVFYYKDGFVKKTEIYGNSPFLIEADWKHPQLVGGMFSLKKNSDKTYSLGIIEEAFSVFSPLDPHYKTSASQLNNIAGEYSFGQWVQGDHFKFKISDIAAENGEEIADEVEKELGLKINIIDGDQEAQLINVALWSYIDHKTYLHVDVGGGSTELNIYQNSVKIASKSFKWGSVRTLDGEDSPIVWESMSQFIIDHLGRKAQITCIGTGGNINKIFELSKPDKRKRFLDKSKIQEILTKLESYSYEERINILYLNPDRADVIVPAAKIYLAAMKAANSKRMIVPDVGLKDGVINVLFERNKDKEQSSSS